MPRKKIQFSNWKDSIYSLWKGIFEGAEFVQATFQNLWYQRDVSTGRKQVRHDTGAYCSSVHVASIWQLQDYLCRTQSELTGRTVWLVCSLFSMCDAFTLLSCGWTVENRTSLPPNKWKVNFPSYQLPCHCPIIQMSKLHQGENCVLMR